MQTMRLLFVCTGNTCRSPMAAALTQQLGTKLALPFQVQVRSRGLYAVDGEPMSVHAQEALAERGVTADHRAAMLDEADLEWADLVLAMTMQHKRFLWEAFPEYQEKTFTLKEYIRELENSVQIRIQTESHEEQDAVNGTHAEAVEKPAQENQAKDTPTIASAPMELTPVDDFSWEYLENYFSSLDIPDPYGGDLEVYRRTRDELESAIHRLLELLTATVDKREDRI